MQWIESCRQVSLPNVAFLPASIDACALYRMFVPHMHTPGSIFSFKEGRMDTSPFAHCGVAVIQRLCTRENYDAIIALKKMGLKLIYDLDDNLWAVPTYNPSHQIFRKMERGFRFCAAECDAITVSTNALKVAASQAMSRNRHTKKTPRIEVVPNGMDFDWIAPVPEQYRKKKDGRVVLGWAGTNTHVGEVDAVFGLLPKLLEKLPNLHLEFVGLPAPDVFKAELLNIDGLKTKRIVHPRVVEHDFVPIAEFPVRWSSWQWDISIAPLALNRFNASKSNIKMLEAAALSIPCLVSPAPPYKDFCQLSPLLKKHLLCENLSDWEEKITALVMDEELRVNIGKELRKVASLYDAKKVAETWHSLFEDLV